MEYNFYLGEIKKKNLLLVSLTNYSSNPRGTTRKPLKCRLLVLRS